MQPRRAMLSPAICPGFVSRRTNARVLVVALDSAFEHFWARCVQLSDCGAVVHAPLYDLPRGAVVRLSIYPRCARRLLLTARVVERLGGQGFACAFTRHHEDAKNWLQRWLQLGNVLPTLCGTIEDLVSQDAPPLRRLPKVIVSTHLGIPHER